MPKDYSKYRFKGDILPKNRLVLAVIREFIKEKQPTLPELQEAFPKELQGALGVFLSKDDYEKKKQQSDDIEKRFFSSEEELLKTYDEREILVCTQWGSSNLERFVVHASSLGFAILKEPATLTNEEILQEFLHKPAFKRNYQTWPDITLNAFCDLIRMANRHGLDVFIVNMHSGNAFRIGRRELNETQAKSVFATLNPITSNINYSQRFGFEEQHLKEELNINTLEQLEQSGAMDEFNAAYPISRGPHLPSDYKDSDETMLNKRIWKVSHSPNSFNRQTLDWLSDNNILAVHQNTGNGSASSFRKIEKGDIVNLGHGNTVFRLVRVISGVEHITGSELGDEWLMRRYEIIKALDEPVKYTFTGKYKRWSPRYNGTSWKVPRNEYALFEMDILNRYYDLRLSDLGILIDEDIGKAPSQISSTEMPPLNQILFGPPGTGKTYSTIDIAVKAADPQFVPEGDNLESERKSLKSRYDELLAEERIRFVTFHQSYGYEEFVEGLSAKTEGEQVSYYEKDGIFKIICKEAAKYRVANCASSDAEFDERWQKFSDTLAESDSGIKVSTLSGKTYFTVTDVNNNTIRFDKSQGASVHSMTVKTLKAVYNGEKEIKGGLKPYYGALVKHLTDISIQNNELENERKNFVLIIDEINRGNISKVFGELITLIEPSKRLGSDEQIEVSLPYSNDPFSVPDNLYIVGTMNTADRSLALMDTALRRRFNFVEMMPELSVLEDESGNPYIVEINEQRIVIPLLLKTLNERISALYDREHMLGHAFFMPVVHALQSNDHERALSELARVFQSKIIPLLAEYFFEDWQKIRLVLADNQKEKAGIEPIVTKTPIIIDSLFGDAEEFNDFDDEMFEYKLASLDEPLWDEPTTYSSMYGIKK